MRLAIAVVLSRVIFLQHAGATLMPGENDSRVQTSSLVAHRVHVPAWDVDPADWAATVACMQAMWAPFDVAVTDLDPGDVPHIEVVLGGKAADLGLDVSAAGVSPFRSDCEPIEDSIVFAFTDVLHDHPQLVCEVATQEIGHSYGLDHELLASDPMTYLPYAGKRAFRDETAACGESTPRPCGAGCRPDQNSMQLLTARLGARPPTFGDVPADAPGDTGESAPGEPAGCSASGGRTSPWALLVAIALAVSTQRRRRAVDSY